MSQRESLQVDDNNGPLLAPAADESGMGEQRLLDDEQEESGNKPSTGKMLAISFVAMVFVGLGNKVFNKLQTVPMQNYPMFLNLLTTFVYIPLSFAYILPMIKWGSTITPESRQIPKYKFAVMGGLDAVAGLMQIFATTYITSGSLIILLTQAAIPISMAISRFSLGAKYTVNQYLGAGAVLCGLVVVLLPSFQQSQDDTGGQNQVVWAVVMILSCIPMTLSSVYKEKALGDTDIDVVYLNGWVAVFQFLVSIPLSVPSGYSVNVPVEDLGANLWNGTRCYAGVNSIANGTVLHGHALPGDSCAMSPLYVSTYLVFNLGYNILIVFILKYGSANILWLAMTIMVPLGNAVFALPFVPAHKPMRLTDIVGLIVILGGLIGYRFADKALNIWRNKSRTHSMVQDDATEREASRMAVLFTSANGVEAAQPIINTLVRQRQALRLLRSPLQIRSGYLSRLGIRSPRQGYATVRQSERRL